jgi:hypothetical protein
MKAPKIVWTSLSDDVVSATTLNGVELTYIVLDRGEYFCSEFTMGQRLGWAKKYKSLASAKRKAKKQIEKVFEEMGEAK